MVLGRGAYKEGEGGGREEERERQGEREGGREGEREGEGRENGRGRQHESTTRSTLCRTAIAAFMHVADQI